MELSSKHNKNPDNVSIILLKDKRTKSNYPDEIRYRHNLQKNGFPKFFENSRFERKNKAKKYWYDRRRSQKLKLNTIFAF